MAQSPSHSPPPLDYASPASPVSGLCLKAQSAPNMFGNYCSIIGPPICNQAEMMEEGKRFVFLMRVTLLILPMPSAIISQAVETNKSLLLLGWHQQAMPRPDGQAPKWIIPFQAGNIRLPKSWFPQAEPPTCFDNISKLDIKVCVPPWKRDQALRVCR